MFTKSVALLAVVMCALLTFQCKTVQPTAPSRATPSLLDAANVLDSTQTAFIAFANQTNGDPVQAIVLTTAWLQTQPNVKIAYTLDSTYITIIMNSGLETCFYYDETDASGNSIHRGGNSHASTNLRALTTHTQPADNEITNKKVLLFAAGANSLVEARRQLPITADRLTKAGLGLDVTVLTDAQCTYGVVEHFGDYGLVIMDTHGKPDGFLVGSTLNFATHPATEDAVKSVVTTQVSADAYNKFTTGQLQLGARVRVNPALPNWQKSVLPHGESRHLLFIPIPQHAPGHAEHGDHRQHVLQRIQHCLPGPAFRP